MDHSTHPNRPLQSPVAGPGGRRDSMRSSYSIVSDVEMARNEVFDGPISESIPSSIASFSYRRNRNNSTASFTYFHENESFTEWPNEDALDIGSDNDEEFRDGAYPASIGWKDPLWTNAKMMRMGLDADDRDSREQVFGKNLIDIHQKSALELLLDETMSRLRSISLFECDIRVLRNSFWRSVPSRELVPGDVFEFSDPSLNQVPCDCILLSGDCIVNESMLTGESVPISKTPLTDDALSYLDLNASSVHPNIAKNFLFSGTRVIRTRRPQNVDDDEAIALAIVVRTGFLTTKGALVRSMLFPKPSGFKFYRDSFRYISVMGVVALLGFVASFVNFVRLGLSWHLIIVRALDLITIVVPPALPATLTIGINFALSRLKNHKIFCISPQRVNIGGKLDVVCFDKTGTLTEDGLDVLGVRTVNHEMRLTDLLSDMSFLPSSIEGGNLDNRTKISYIMATCHSLKTIDDDLLGDPLDVKMFEFTGWSYQEGGGQVSEQPSSNFEAVIQAIAKPPNSPAQFRDHGGTRSSTSIELGILRSFEFVSELRRSSVVVRQFGDGGASVFVKGAPESVKAICRPETLPHDFEDLLNQYTHQGYRVIACAAKYEQRLSWMKVQKLTRVEAESNLEFIGLIIFENKLKPKSSETIRELSQAGIRNIMCTGDNILTAVSVARECGLISADKPCFIPHFVEGYPDDPKISLHWESVDDPCLKLDPNTLMPPLNSTDIDLSVPTNVRYLHEYSLAVSGDVFRWIVDYGDEIILKRHVSRISSA
ncbi:hypothetical protein N8T08_010085 [Aspergillus melleus]|uniref:Uncharacterized protein n=1 Tax=Aspergillus melleus TaxID=138277 RepID=A0ACC3BCP1_9EURO|nr:hypothetical protein N8T08_010085 [Aspergillus melleus]